MCSKVPKAVSKAEEKIDSFDIGEYATRNVGTFWVTQAVAERGEIVEEQEAQDACYDAMGMASGSNAKLLKVLSALNHFPLSTEAWGMLGHFYQYEVTKDPSKKKLCAAEALKMYDNAVKCATILNPAWSEERREPLIGDVDLKPYMRALYGRATTLRDMGQIHEAIAKAKNLIILNPSDNQGIRDKLCTWFLEVRDTEGCAHLLRKYARCIDTHLAYADVLMQYFLWKRGDTGEKDVKKALYFALKENPHVPDLLQSADTGVIEEEADEDCIGYSPGSTKEAKIYVEASYELWRSCQECVHWIESQRHHEGRKVPPSEDTHLRSWRVVCPLPL